MWGRSTTPIGRIAVGTRGLTLHPVLLLILVHFRLAAAGRRHILGDGGSQWFLLGPRVSPFGPAALGRGLRPLTLADCHIAGRVIPVEPQYHPSQFSRFPSLGPGPRSLAAAGRSILVAPQYHPDRFSGFSHFRRAALRRSTGLFLSGLVQGIHDFADERFEVVQIVFQLCQKGHRRSPRPSTPFQ